MLVLALTANGLSELVDGTLELFSFDNLKLIEERETSNSVVGDACTDASLTLCSSGTAPYVNFSSSGGIASGNVDSCCPGSFTACQIQLNEQLCRDIVTYTINPGESPFVEVCPVVTPNCYCQESLSAGKSLVLSLCPTPGSCCPTCECHGDPHCTSFQNGTKVWAICDDRGPTCVHEKSTCLQTSYNGFPCVWVAHNHKMPYCTRPTSSPTPFMTMYTKSYQSYFNPNDTTEYQFSIILTLGIYGSITNIAVTDAGITYNFGFTNSGKCAPDPRYPLNSQGQSIINNLPSGVYLVLLCNEAPARSPTGTRWDVEVVQDPWFVFPHPPTESFGGFCATGVISGIVGPASGNCTVFDNQVAKYLRCHGSLTQCKTQWCRKWATKLQFGAADQTVAEARASCDQFLLSSAPLNNNFLIAVCAVSPSVANGVYPVDPTQCMNNQACQQCVNNVMDYPYDMRNILNSPNLVTMAPTIPCPSDLLEIGLQRKLLPSGVDGIEIDYQATSDSSWVPVFALLDIEIEACGCNNPLLVNGTDPLNQPLLNAGNYRIKQCHGLNTSPSQDLCKAVPKYNVTVDFNFPFGGALISTPFAQLFNNGQLVCSPEIYPNCPKNYSCCIWDSTLEKSGWEICMASTYGPNWQTLYPNCH